MAPVYLDYAATTPCDPAVVKAMLPYFRLEFGNPACGHSHGKTAKQAVETARAQVAGLIGAKPNEIFFTSGATEADNLALKGALPVLGRPYIITCATEHKAVLKTCKCLEDDGFDVTYLPVDGNGFIDLDMFYEIAGPHIGMVSIMAGNNETGTVQNLEAIGTICRNEGILFHTDAAQGFGKIPLNVDRIGASLMSISGHKIYGPKGVGALYVRGGENAPLVPQMDGGGQECNLRSGTLNVPAIVGFGHAAALAQRNLQRDAQHTRQLRERLLHQLANRTEVYETVDVAEDERLPGTLNVAFPGVRAKDLLGALAGKVSVTSGSACSAGCAKPSHVVQAMRHPYPQSTMRFTVGRPTTVQQVDRAAALVGRAVSALR